MQTAGVRHAKKPLQQILETRRRQFASQKKLPARLLASSNSKCFLSIRSFGIFSLRQCVSDSSFVSEKKRIFGHQIDKEFDGGGVGVLGGGGVDENVGSGGDAVDGGGEERNKKKRNGERVAERNGRTDFNVL